MIYIFENCNYRGEFATRDLAAKIVLRISGMHIDFHKRPETDERNAYEFYLEFSKDRLHAWDIIDAEDYIINRSTIHPNLDPAVNSMMLSYEDAEKFFQAFYRMKGKKFNLWPYGTGWKISLEEELSNYDFNNLTRLVVMAHDMCYRVMIRPESEHSLSCSLHKKNRSGPTQEVKFPTIERAVEQIRIDNHKRGFVVTA